MVEFGYFSLIVGFCLAVYGLGLGIAGLFRPSQGVAYSARNALIAVSFTVCIAAGTLWYALLSHDFSVRYVFRNSSVDMPPMYLLTAFWSSLEGSHLVWTLILSVVSAIALSSVRERNLPLLPGLNVGFGLSLTFMLLLNVWASSPLERMFPLGQFGAGMNALLQNPYMAAHPPSLFLGYCALIVPFAYSVAALLRGSFTPDWLVTVRRWSLFAWATLTVGIFLGGKWAYVELGWAGYWAWDPVENSSFMPWLALTAALHTLLILDKTGRLPRLTTFLSMLGFILTFLGTFITRSGVISSVHSFAESNIGPAYLSYVVLLLLFAIGLVFSRGSLLQGAGKSNTWVMSKESTLLFTDFFLLFLLALVATGTLLPLIVEAIRGVKISIQQPFFNAFTPWIGIGLVSILGIGNLMRWRNGKMEDPVASLVFPLIWALPLTAILFARKGLDLRSAIGFFLIFWSAGSLIMDLVFKLRAIRWNGKAFLKFNRPYLGAWIAHIGFLVAIAGFLGAYRGVEQQTTLDVGQSTEFYGYTLTNRGIAFSGAYNYQLAKARIEAVDSQGNTSIILPTRSKYTNKEEWLNEIGVHSTFWHDVYLVLASFDSRTQQVALKMHINPTVKLVWTSLVIMVLGALVGLSHRIRRRSIDISPNGLALETATEGVEDLLGEILEKDPFRGGHATNTPRPSSPKTDRPDGFATSVGIVAFAILLSVFGFSGVAWAQGNVTTEDAQNSAGAAGAPGNSSMPTLDSPLTPPQLPKAPTVQLDPRLREIGEELRCPTCQGISVLESETPQSVAMKAEIEKQLLAGKSKQEILDFFKERYGEWILREPDARTGVGFWIWAFPVAGLLIGPVVLLFALRRSRARVARERAELVAEVKAFIQSQSGSSSTPGTGGH